MKNILKNNLLLFTYSRKKLIFVFFLLLILALTGCKSAVKIVFPNGETYVGEVESGKPHGQGTWTSPIGEKYVGEFKKGKKHGQGTWTSPIGWGEEGICYTSKCRPGHVKFVGEFKDDKMWNGTRFKKHGKIFGKIVNGGEQKSPTSSQAIIHITFVNDKEPIGGHAKQRLISIGYNVPRRGSLDELNQEFVGGLNLEPGYKERFVEIQNSINAVLGGYPNYVNLAYDPNGTEEDAKPLFDRLTEIEYKPKVKQWTIAELDKYKSCLSGSDPGGWRTPSTYPYSICLESLEKIYAYRYERGPPTRRNYAQLALHYAHEYFHHYQRAHALERGLDYQDDTINPESTVQAPTWWTEGAAIAFQNAWYKSNWNSLSFLKDEKNVSIGDIAWRSRGSHCSSDWFMNESEEKYSTRSGCSSAVMAVAFMAHLTSWKTVWIDIPQDYYDLGFWGAFEKHIGMTNKEFYDAYNKFLRSGNDPPQGWTPPQGPISEYADFWEIIPESIEAPIPMPELKRVVFGGLIKAEDVFETAGSVIEEGYEGDIWIWSEYEDANISSKYEGGIRNGFPNGQGTLIHPDGTKYVGKFRKGKKHGQGIYTYPNGAKYIGEYKDGLRNGQGTWNFNDGKKFVGEFKDDQMWNGTVFSKNGEITGNMVIGIGFKKNGEIVGKIKIVNGGKIKAEQIAEDKKLIINEKIEFYKQARANEDDKAASQILGSLMNMLGYIPSIASHTEHEWIWSEHEDSQINLKGEICENIVNGDGALEFKFNYHLHSSLPNEWVEEFKIIMANLEKIIPVKATSYLCSLDIFSWQDITDRPFKDKIGKTKGTSISGYGTPGSNEHVRFMVLEMPSSEFKNNYIHRYLVIPHEYLHVYHLSLAKYKYYGELDIKWLSEGSATTFESLYSQQYYNINYFKKGFSRQVPQAAINNPKIFESSDDTENGVSSVFMVLALVKELTKLDFTEEKAFKLIFNDFWRKNPNNYNWKIVFRDVFKINLENFYQNLSNYTNDIYSVLPSESIKLENIFSD